MGRCWGLALGGGGLPGIAAHLGFLSVLERNGLVPGIVVGTSAGGIVAGSMGAGIPLSEIETFWKGLGRDWWRFAAGDVASAVDLVHATPTPGLLRLDNVIQASLRGPHATRVTEWRAGYGVTVTNLSDRDASAGSIVVSRDTGGLGLSTRDALTATAAFPLLFCGVRTALGALLCDGGLYDMVPVDACRTVGADRVVSVAIGTPPRVSPELDLSRLAQIVVARSLARTNRSANAIPSDLRYRITIRGGLLSFDDFAADLQAGATAATGALPAIIAMARSAR